MRLIAAVSRSWGIGLDDRLLFHIPEDLHRFRELTIGGTLILGRKTLDTLPGGRPLPGRTTVVLTRQQSFNRDGVRVVHTREELSDLLPQLPTPVYAAGGGEVYRLLLPLCSRADVTLVDADPPANVFLPDLFHTPGWRCEELSPAMHWQGVEYRFGRFTRTSEP